MLSVDEYNARHGSGELRLGRYLRNAGSMRRGIGLARVYDLATTICAENNCQLITMISLAPNLLAADVLETGTLHWRLVL